MPTIVQKGSLTAHSFTKKATGDRRAKHLAQGADGRIGRGGIARQVLHPAVGARDGYCFGLAGFLVMRLYTTSATMAMRAVTAKMTMDSAILPDTRPAAA